MAFSRMTMTPQDVSIKWQCSNFKLQTQKEDLIFYFLVLVSWAEAEAMRLLL